MIPWGKGYFNKAWSFGKESSLNVPMRVQSGEDLKFVHSNRFQLLQTMLKRRSELSSLAIAN